MRRWLRSAVTVVLTLATSAGGLPAAAQEPASPAAPPQVAPLASTPVPDPVRPGPPRPRPRPRPAAPSGVPAAPAPGVPVLAPGLIAAPPVAGARLGPGAPIPQPELEAFIDGAVRDAMSADHIPGVVVSVVQLGQPVFRKGYGYASLEQGRPMDPDRTLVRIGSISKTFTAIALMRQVEAGRMGLNNPVNQYLPQRLQLKDQGFDRPITLRDLLNHTAGFEDRALGHLFEERPDRVRPLDAYLRRERPDRVREAGGLPIYSNYGSALAGQAVSEVARQPFAQLIERDILLPLGMARTSFREPYPAGRGLPGPLAPALAGDLAKGYRWTGAELEPRSFEYVSQIAPAGAASSTASDMARYMALILGDGTLEGRTIYSPATAAAFRSVQARGAPGVEGWANGFHQYALPGGFTGFGHAGATLSFHSNLVTAPQLGLGVFVAGNSETAYRLADRLPAMIVQRFYGGPRTLPAASTADLGRYAGLYWTERRAYSGLEKFVTLFGGRAAVEAKNGRLVIVSPQGAATYAPLGGGRFQALESGQVSAFQMDGGRPARWFAPWGGESFHRVGVTHRLETVAFLGLAAIIAAIATLTGLLVRDRRDFRQTSTQGRASALQTASSVLWILGMTAFWLWAAPAAADAARAVYDWPGPWLVLASACGLIAAVLSVAAAALLPIVWRGGRRLDSWTIGRKARFTVTALVYLALSIVLTLNGALEPWTG